MAGFEEQIGIFVQFEGTKEFETTINVRVNAGVAPDIADFPQPMFELPPGRWLHKQGNFIASFFPDMAEPGVGYDFFYLPPIDDAYGRPFLVAGDMMGMFNDRPAVRATMESFTRGESVSHPP